MPALAPVVLSLALGLWGIGRDGALWRDEVVSYDLSRRELPDLTRTLERADAVHGLYYLLLHALFRLFPGADPLLVLRLPSVLAVAVTAGLLTLLGARYAGPRAGLLAGLVFAVLPPVQRYAQEGRSYALVCALVVWATCLLVRAVDTGTARAWAGYGAVLLTACLLHEFAVLVLAAHAVAVPREARRAWLRTVCPVVAALAPLAVLSMRQSAQVAWIGGLGAGALLGFGGVALLGCACATVLPRALVRLALPLTVLPAGLLMLVSLAKPLYVDRYVLYGQAGTALLVGAALDRLIRAGGPRRAAALLAAGAAVAALLPSPRTCAPRAAAWTTSPPSARPYVRRARAPTGSSTCRPAAGSGRSPTRAPCGGCATSPWTAPPRPPERCTTRRPGRP
ncbi:glycosyltransferase family 39 protein [Streptomyces sp. NPDC058683]|uniref:glycosyltransferase family 39 protein n=1 Tax=Streptomyces sp. NPDC058683 TaxID=3346597 RepID=UPI00365AE511